MIYDNILSGQSWVLVATSLMLKIMTIMWLKYKGFFFVCGGFSGSGLNGYFLLCLWVLAQLNLILYKSASVVCCITIIPKRVFYKMRVWKNQTSVPEPVWCND